MDNTTQFSKDDAWTLADALRALGIEASVTVRDYVTPERKVAEKYSVRAVISDARHGNVVIRELTAPAVATDVAADMAREIKDRAKKVQARRRVQRAADRS
jgi:uridylate kinase